MSKRQFDPMEILTLARDNKADEIKALAALGFPVDLGNQVGQTALHIASLWGNLEAMTALLEQNADANIENQRGTVPLHFAACARKNALQACQILLKYGADPQKADQSGRLPYMGADSDEVRQLLGGPDSRLFRYCEEGKTQELAELLKSGSVPTIRVLDTDGATPLTMAIASRSLPTVQVLLEHDRELLNMSDSTGNTALHCAVQCGDAAVMKLLLSHSPTGLNMQNFNPSDYAQGDWITNGEVILPLDKTALHLAAEQGDVQMVQLLVEAGADLEMMDFDDRTALHLAIEQQDNELIDVLLAAGANVNAPNKDFTSAVHYAASRGKPAMLKKFLEKGGDAKAVNSDGWTPLHLAARTGSKEKLEMLLDAGCPIDAVNSHLNTALHLAAVNGHAEAVKTLLSRGADASLRNKDGKTPKDMAKTPALAELLPSPAPQA